MSAQLRSMSRMAMVAALALAAAATGCTRQLHRRPAYGAANHTFFDRQAEATARGQAHGLDPEEAAMIHAKYREALGGKAAGKADARSQVLILQEGGDAGKRQD